MIIFLILTVFIFDFSLKYKRVKVSDVLFFYNLSLFVFILKLIEFSNGQIDFFISDEKYYFAKATYDIFNLDDKERYLWLLVNYIFKVIDIFGDYGVKLVNIPIGLLAFVALNRAYGINFSPVKYVLFLPYFLVTLTFNLRDNLILLFSLLLFIYLDKVSLKNIWIVLLLSIGLAFTRPLFIFLIIIIFIFVKVFFSKNSGQKKHSSIKYIFPLLVFIGLGLFLVGDFLSDIYFRYYFNMEFMIENDFQRKSVEIGYDSSGVFLIDFANSLLRFVFAPLPHSLVKRLFEEITIWGITDEILRIINQSFYFLFLVYLIFNMRSLFIVVKQMNNISLMVTLFLFSQVFIYSIYQLGGVHQRTKMPFQVLIFVLCYLVYYNKKSLRYAKKKHSNSL
jgi:hypothetical protein